jgi:hypothetical protein
MHLNSADLPRLSYPFVDLDLNLVIGSADVEIRDALLCHVGSHGYLSASLALAGNGRVVEFDLGPWLHLQQSARQRLFIRHWGAYQTQVVNLRNVTGKFANIVLGGCRSFIKTNNTHWSIPPVKI